MKMNISSMVAGVLLTAALAAPVLVSAHDPKMEEEAMKAKAHFIKTDAGMANPFANAYGYVIFPNVGKGGLGVGAAGGHGIVYENGVAIGKATMTQITVGAQAGAQSYREVIFFETKDALEHFKNNHLEFSAQTSAVASASGASADAKYRDGVMVFTEERGGLMVEASVGGQKFNYESY